jgi:hypothetical protein
MVSEHDKRMPEDIVTDSKAGPLVRIRVTPRSSRPRVKRGPGHLVVAVRAPAERGRATEEALQAIARTLGLARSAVSLRMGATSRIKHVCVTGLTTSDLRKRILDRVPEEAR